MLIAISYSKVVFLHSLFIYTILQEMPILGPTRVYYKYKNNELLDAYTSTYLKRWQSKPWMILSLAELRYLLDI